MMRLILATLGLFLAIASPLWSFSAEGAVPCVDGRQSAFLINNAFGCTFGDGLLQVDGFSFTTAFNGEHTSILFLTDPPDVLGPGVQNSSGLDCGAAHTDPCGPERASDKPTGLNTAAVTGNVSTVDGLPEVGQAVVTLLDPILTGGGTLSWSASVNTDGNIQNSGTLDENTPSYTFTFPAAHAIAASYSFHLATNCTPVPCAGDASAFGAKFNFMPVPEPAGFAAEASVLAGLAGLAMRRRARRPR